MTYDSPHKRIASGLKRLYPLAQGLQTFSMEGHIADILKIGGPKLTQIW